MPDVYLPYILVEAISGGDGQVNCSYIFGEGIQGGTVFDIRMCYMLGESIQGGTDVVVRCSRIIREIVFSIPPGGIVLENVFPSSEALPGLTWSVHRRPQFSTLVSPHQSGAEARAAMYEYPIWHFKMTYEFLKQDPVEVGYTALETIMGFYLSRGGQYDPFLFKDPEFNSVEGQVLGTGDDSTAQFDLIRDIGGFSELIGQLDLEPVFSFVSGAVNTTTDLVNRPAHGLTTGYGPVQLTTTGVLPAGLNEETNYWLYVASEDFIGFATSKANAVAGTLVDMTDIGSGTNTASNNIALYLDGTLQDPADYVFDEPNQITFDTAPGDAVEITADFKYFFTVRFKDDELDFEEFMYRLHTLQEVELRTVPNP